MEELGISVRAERFLTRVDHEYEARSITLHLFECSRPEADPKPLGCQSLRWVRPKDLRRYRMPPADEKFLSLVLSGRAAIREHAFSDGAGKCPDGKLPEPQ